MPTLSQSAARWLAIFLPRLSADRLKRCGRAPADGRPLAVYAKAANAFLLTGVDARASALGLRVAMSLADARAIQPSLAAVEAEPGEDARLLEIIAAWCERFSPVVVVDGADGLFLDITGCGHLFGGEAALRAEIVARLEAWGFTIAAAVAPTPGAAWALARYGATPMAQDAATALAPLPVEALRLDEAAAALLGRLGLKTIGQVLAAPRSVFAARAGEAAMLRLDQALGRAPEALSPRRPPPPVTASRRFLEPLFTQDAILEAAAILCADIILKLERRGAGARGALLHLFGVDGRDRVIEAGWSRPERGLKSMMRLFREKLSAAAESLDAEFGIEAARLDIVMLERLEGQARAFAGVEDAGAGAENIGAIVDMLSARLGPRRVLRPKLGDAHAPEKAGAWRAALAQIENAFPANEVGSDGVMRAPLTLFQRAQPIEAIASVPDGPPIRFCWRRVPREVTRAEGPERIAGDWLSGAPTRDYYRVEDKDGRRYWIYREGFYGETHAPRWYVHGLFP